MRGKPDYQSQIYYSIDIEAWIPEDHPLRGVKARAEAVLAAMRKDMDRAYGRVGRRSIPPEMLLKALLLQALYSIRSEEQLVEHIQMNLLYRWFLDLSLDAGVWHPTTFTKNRERFEAHGLLRKFFDQVVDQALVERWASDEHFTVDGTLIESYASMKSLRPKGSADQRVVDGSEDEDPDNPTVSFRGERRSNATHRSLTDPEARLARKSQGQEARLAHGFHVLMENRNGLIMDVAVSEANGTAEREEALVMIRRSKERHGLKPRTLAADKGYDAGPFLHELESEERIVPLVPTRKGVIRGSSPAAEARKRARRRQCTKRYQEAQRNRKRAEEIFGWSKTTGGMRRSRHVGRWKIGQNGLVVAAAYNLLRLSRMASRAQCA
ncbi:MAG TPA: IS5 family transposase [Longimicrobiales bacterium]|nr:IS5 family transposase [Longimicrobiales bacterium]